MEVKKLIKDGMVGVVLARSFDYEGWYTTHKQVQLVFLPELIQLIQSDEYLNTDNGHRMVVNLLATMGIQTSGNGNQLVVYWIPVGTQFKIQKSPCVVRGYYNENILINDDNWITA